MDNQSLEFKKRMAKAQNTVLDSLSSTFSSTFSFTATHLLITDKNGLERGIRAKFDGISIQYHLDTAKTDSYLTLCYFIRDNFGLDFALGVKNG